MELKTTDEKFLVTEEEKKVLQELKGKIPIIKNKFFSLGRDIDNLFKLFSKIK